MLYSLYERGRPQNYGTPAVISWVVCIIAVTVLFAALPNPHETSFSALERSAGANATSAD